MFQRTSIYDAEIYREIITKIFVKAYRLAAIPKDVSLQNIKNAATLLRIKQIIADLSDDEIIQEN
jgi:hypothetical protein